MKYLFIAALLGSATAAPLAAAELVVNGGFEDYADGGIFPAWTQAGNTYPLTGVQGAHSGNVSSVFAGASAQAPATLSQILLTVPGQLYQLTFWYRNFTEVDGQISNDFQISFGGKNIGETFNAADFGYVQGSGNLLATSTTSVLSFVGYNAIGGFLLDDVSVTGVAADGGVPEPATWALLLVGFGGVGVAMRRRGSGARIVAA